MASPRPFAIDKCGFGGLLFKKFDANWRPHPSPLQGRGCHILPFMTVILRYVGVGHVIFKELLCNKLDTPKERVSYPGVSDSNFW